MDRPYPAAALLLAYALTTSATTLAQGNDTLAARSLAASCANCHGTNGRSAGGIPSLAGQSRNSIASAMRDYRDGKRPATVMHQLAKGYTEQQIDMLAAYFAVQK